ncbi:MAG: molybdopterin molybdotransferase MoeA, partial [Gammaproteobacteria bacterium]|nr:molybdopterin molybdotransferase MoeA [Gammaproteobacteria bacterium]
MTKSTVKIDPSCMDDFDPNSLPAEEALRRILDGVKPVSGVEKIPVRNALDRVIAEEITSRINVPSDTNSAMDGYALRGEDLPTSGNCEISVVGTAWAGHPFRKRIRTGECVRIMTGAPMPEGTDTVVMQEHVEPHNGRIKVDARHKRGQNVRQAGEDLKAGGVVLFAGKRLTPAELGLLASLGIGEVPVHRRIRVAFFSTGDELRSIGEPLEPGFVYDSNRYSLHGMLSRLGVDIIDMGVIRDQRQDTLHAFQVAGSIADAVITSGGVSVGEADFVKEALDTVGQVNFWKVAMKPGRPLAFGRLGDALFFGLPGNPVSVMVTFYLFVQPALKRLMGESDTAPPLLLKARCESDLRKKAGRTEYQRGILSVDAHGNLI